jgi:hypothetical protein
MGRKQSKSRDTEDEYSQDDPFAWLSCVLALILGITMLAIEGAKGQSCKLRDVDITSWNNPEQKGQIPLVISLCQILDFDLKHAF